MAFPAGSVVKNLPDNAGDVGDTGSISGSGRSSGEGNGKPLQLLLPGKSRAQRSLVGHSPWGRRVRRDLLDYTTTTAATLHSVKKCH